MKDPFSIRRPLLVEHSEGTFFALGPFIATGDSGLVFLTCELSYQVPVSAPRVVNTRSLRLFHMLDTMSSKSGPCLRNSHMVGGIF